MGVEKIHFLILLADLPTSILYPPLSLVADMGTNHVLRLPCLVVFSWIQPVIKTGKIMYYLTSPPGFL